MLMATACTMEEQLESTTDLIAPSNQGPISMVLLDQSYGAHDNQSFDIYLPEDRNTETTPVLVLIHGGGWTTGDKADLDYMVTELLDRFPNHAIVNANYVLANLPEVPAFPNQFIDIDRLLNYIETQAATYQIAPRFGLIGLSAGAHLALMSDYLYDSEDRIKMVGSIVGPTNLADPFYLNNPTFEDFLSLLYQTNSGESYDGALANLSPITYADGDSSPTLLFYGQYDPMVPPSNGSDLSDRLSDYMISNSLTIYDGAHFFNWAPADIENMYGQIEAYVSQYLNATAVD